MLYYGTLENIFYEYGKSFINRIDNDEKYINNSVGIGYIDNTTILFVMRYIHSRYIEDVLDYVNIFDTTQIFGLLAYVEPCFFQFEYDYANYIFNQKGSINNYYVYLPYEIKGNEMCDSRNYSFDVENIFKIGYLRLSMHILGFVECNFFNDKFRVHTNDSNCQNIIYNKFKGYKNRINVFKYNIVENKFELVSVLYNNLTDFSPEDYNIYPIYNENNIIYDDSNNVVGIKLYLDTTSDTTSYIYQDFTFVLDNKYSYINLNDVTINYDDYIVSDYKHYNISNNIIELDRVLNYPNHTFKFNNYINHDNNYIININTFNNKLYIFRQFDSINNEKNIILTKVDGTNISDTILKNIVSLLQKDSTIYNIVLRYNGILKIYEAELDDNLIFKCTRLLKEKNIDVPFNYMYYNENNELLLYSKHSINSHSLDMYLLPQMSDYVSITNWYSSIIPLIDTYYTIDMNKFEWNGFFTSLLPREYNIKHQDSEYYSYITSRYRYCYCIVDKNTNIYGDINDVIEIDSSTYGIEYRTMILTDNTLHDMKYKYLMLTYDNIINNNYFILKIPTAFLKSIDTDIHFEVEIDLIDVLDLVKRSKFIDLVDYKWYLKLNNSNKLNNINDITSFINNILNDITVNIDSISNDYVLYNDLLCLTLTDTSNYIVNPIHKYNNNIYPIYLDTVVNNNNFTYFNTLLSQQILIDNTTYFVVLPQYTLDSTNLIEYKTFILNENFRHFSLVFDVTNIKDKLLHNNINTNFIKIDYVVSDITNINNYLLFNDSTNIDVTITDYTTENINYTLNDSTILLSKTDSTSYSEVDFTNLSIDGNIYIEISTEQTNNYNLLYDNKFNEIDNNDIISLHFENNQGLFTNRIVIFFNVVNNVVLIATVNITKTHDDVNNLVPLSMISDDYFYIPNNNYTYNLLNYNSLESLNNNISGNLYEYGNIYLNNHKYQLLSIYGEYKYINIVDNITDDIIYNDTNFVFNNTMWDVTVTKTLTDMTEYVNRLDLGYNWLNRKEFDFNYSYNIYNHDATIDSTVIDYDYIDFRLILPDYFKTNNIVQISDIVYKLFYVSTSKLNNNEMTYLRDNSFNKLLYNLECVYGNIDTTNGNYDRVLTINKKLNNLSLKNIYVSFTPFYIANNKYVYININNRGQFLVGLLEGDNPLRLTKIKTYGTLSSNKVIKLKRYINNYFLSSYSLLYI